VSLLNYEVHNNVVSHHDAIAKIKTFAEAKGWTIVEFQQNVVWADQGGGSYGWSAGSETFLAIQSSGYGAQTLHFRLRSRAEGTDPNHEFVDIGAQKAGETTITNISTHPVDQNNLKINNSISFKPGTIEKLWLFGDAKHVIVFAKFDSKFCQALCFGTIELFDSSEAEGNYIGHSQINQARKWYEYTDSAKASDFLCPWDNQEDTVLYDGILKLLSDVKYEIVSDPTNAILGGYSKLTRAVQINNFSGARVLIKPKVFIKRDLDSRFFPLGHFPIYRVYHPGLQIGEQLDYSGESFLCFPAILLQDRNYGVAIRIA